ncbi:glycosyltransferase [Flavobacteriaceae bacterium]|nr:glycosyltransferase [Flavobacteriaceae bacterium]
MVEQEKNKFLMNKNVLFVGAFNKRNTKNLIGGQLFACSTILKSSLSKKYNFINLCTSQRKIPPPNLFIRTYDSFVRIFKLFKILMFNKIDIALIFTTSGLGFIEKGLMVQVCKKFNVKTVLFPRSGLIVNDVKNKFFENYLKTVINNTDVLMLQGKSWLDFYKKYENSKTIYKIQQNWIDNKKYQVNDRKFHKKDLNILFLGWINKEKGVFDLLSVFRSIVNKMQNYNLNLFYAGKGKDYFLLREKIEKYRLTRSVKLLGWVNDTDKLKLLQNSDVYVCPSYFEGLPNSLLESMASGIPSISTNVGSIPNLISDTNNGFLYNPGQNDRLESLLINLLEDFELRKKISVNSKKHIANNNTIEIATKTIDKIFTNI